jgi:hypothetical protein
MLSARELNWKICSSFLLLCAHFPGVTISVAVTIIMGSVKGIVNLNSLLLPIKSSFQHYCFLEWENGESGSAPTFRRNVFPSSSASSSSILKTQTIRSSVHCKVLPDYKVSYHSRRWSSLLCLKLEAHSSETLVNFYLDTGRYSPEKNRNTRRYENSKSSIVGLFKTRVSTSAPIGSLQRSQ